MRVRAAVTTTALCCALLGGCATTGPVPVDAGAALLAARVPVDRAAAAMHAARNELLAVVATTAGGLRWAELDEATPEECGPPLAGLGGQVRELGTNAATASALPRWPAVLAAATHSATSNGLSQVVVEVDRPELHQVRFVAPDGAYLDLVTDASSTTVRAATGCHPVL